MAQGKYIAYYRVSTQKQGKSGLGLEAQQAAVHTYLNGGNWELLREFTEIESGTRKGNGKRPALAAALAECKIHKATLLIAKLDRLYRNVAAQSALMESGVDFVAIDNATATRFTLHILSAVAEDEAVKISQRTKDALSARRAKGLPMGAKCWDMVDKNGSPIDHEGLSTLSLEDREECKLICKNGEFTKIPYLSRQDHLKGIAVAALVNKAKADEAAKMFCAKITEIKQELGELSLNAVARELNRRRITTARGSQWTPTAVKNALSRL